MLNFFKTPADQAKDKLDAEREDKRTQNVDYFARVLRQQLDASLRANLSFLRPTPAHVTHAVLDISARTTHRIPWPYDDDIKTVIVRNASSQPVSLFSGIDGLSGGLAYIVTPAPIAPSTETPDSTPMQDGCKTITVAVPALGVGLVRVTLLNLVLGQAGGSGGAGGGTLAGLADIDFTGAVPGAVLTDNT